MTKLKLSYFDINGRAEVARLILAFAGVEFEDHRFSFEEWATIKPETPFGKVPVLYIDGIPLCENGAIVRYLASLHGLNGESLLQQAFVEMAAGTLMDVFGKIPYMEQDEEKKEEGTKIAFKDHIIPTLTKMEKKLKERGAKFLIGNKASYADLTLMNLFIIAEARYSSRLSLEDYPCLNDLKKRLQVTEGVKQYLAKHPT